MFAITFKILVHIFSLVTWAQLSTTPLLAPAAALTLQQCLEVNYGQYSASVAAFQSHELPEVLNSSIHHTLIAVARVTLPTILKREIAYETEPSNFLWRPLYLAPAPNRYQSSFPAGFAIDILDADGFVPLYRVFMEWREQRTLGGSSQMSVAHGESKR